MARYEIKGGNPLYGSVSGYNEKTAEVMADTFPSILTSNLLQKRVMEEAEWKLLPQAAEIVAAEIAKRKATA